MVTPRSQRVLEFMASTARQELVRGGFRFQRTMQITRLSGPTTPASLSVRTGALRRSIRHEVVQTGRYAYTLIGVIGQGVPYARIHEFGGTIEPKKAKHLAIPLQRGAKTAFGPSAYPGKLTFIKSKAGNKLLAEVTGRGTRRRIKPVFVLKKQVVVPARLGFRQTFQQEAQVTLVNIQQKLQVIKMRGGR